MIRNNMSILWEKKIHDLLCRYLLINLFIYNLCETAHTRHPDFQKLLRTMGYRGRLSRYTAYRTLNLKGENLLSIT